MKNRGFTLIETIITLTILAFMTMMAARTIRQAFQAQTKIQNQIDQVSHVKDTLRLMERDINLAYHYTDLQKDIAEELSKTQKKQTPQQPNPPGFPGVTPPPSSGNNPYLKTENRVDPTTHFIGKEEEMHFVTLNTVRLIKDSPQADFGEVSYFLNSCKNRVDKKFEAGKCLFRRTSPLVDKDPTKGGTATQLLPDITEFKLRYFSKVQKDWVKDWNSKDDSPSPQTKGFYPEAVEINLTVETQPKDPKVTKKKKISIQMVVPVHFPNNKDTNQDAGTKTPDGSTTGSPNPTPTPGK